MEAGSHESKNNYIKESRITHSINKKVSACTVVQYGDKIGFVVPRGIMPVPA